MRHPVPYVFTVLAALLCVVEPSRAETARPPVIGPTVTPDGSAATALYGSSSNSVVFTISNTSGSGEYYDLSCSRTGQVTTCSISGTTWAVYVPANSSINRTVWYSMGSGPGTGTVRLTAIMYGEEELCPEPDPEQCPPPPSWQDTGYYNVSAPPPPQATVSWGWNPRRTDYGMCAFSCFAATYAQGTVPYFSLDAARNVTLAYNGDQTALKPFVLVDVLHTPTVPDTVRFQVTVNGIFVTFLNGEQILRFTGGGVSQPLRIGGQIDAVANGLGTGLHPIQVTVTSVYNGSYGGYQAGTVTRVISSHLAIVDERNAWVARGWTFAGVQRLYSQGDTLIVIAEGTGSHTSFVKAGSTYVGTAGDFTKLEVFASSEKYVRTYPDSSRAIFDVTGRLIKVRNRFGTETQFSYDASSRLSYVQENGWWTAIVYNANGLASIRDPFYRYTYVTVNAGRLLTAIQDPDGVSTTFGYDGSQRLQTITDRNGKATTLAYDAQSGKLASVQAPQVYVSGVGNRNPTTWFTPWQTRGVPYMGTSGTPALPVPVDSVDGIDPILWTPS